MDVTCMRYGCKIFDKGHTHSLCLYGETDSVDHSLICKLGGYISMRHNSNLVGGSEAQITMEICRDVQTEPMLLLIN